MTNLDEIAERLTGGADVKRDIESLTPATVTELILRLLQRKDEAYFHAASLYRDLVMTSDGLGDSVADQLRRSYFAGEPQSIVEKLEDGVLDKSLVVRPWAIYTLGKICSTRSLPRLREVFQMAIDRYPDVVLDLATEIDWLERQEDAPVRTGESCIAQLSTSKSYLNRWAAVEAFSICSFDQKDIASKLRVDAHPYVSNLASQLIPEDPDKYRASRLAIGWIATAFRSVRKAGEYKVEDFEQFVDTYMAKHAPKLRRKAHA